MKTIMRMVCGFFASSFVFGALADGPAVSDVVVRQRWPWSRLVDINYMLDGGDGQRADVQLSAFDGFTKLSLPWASLSGDLYGVSRGARRIVWDPMKTAYTNQVLMRFNVEFAPTNSPLYMIVDLTQSAGASGQIEYVYEGDLTNGLWGTWERNPVTNFGTVVESVIWTGVTNGSTYKTDKLVLRRVRAGTFLMGNTVPPTKSVTLTKDFYAGVFETTEAQWNRIMGGGGSSIIPKNGLSYNTIRGATNNVPPVDWPSTGSFVSTNNFIGKLRLWTGISGFDLPTDAQWEYLCRAGTTSYYNDGASTSASDTNILNRLAWWTKNSGGAFHAVGEKVPNAWGLYDTHGSEWEWCLDWYVDLGAGPFTDPMGPTVGSKRCIRGDGYMYTGANTCASGNRGSGAASEMNGVYGFRLVIALP